MNGYIKDNSKNLLRQMDKAQNQALENYGKNWKKIVQRIIKQKDIIDTGTLLNSMDYSVNQQDKTVTTGTDVHYAIYNELGTYRMPARPFMQPSLQEANGALVEILRQELENGLKSTQGLTAEIKNL